jgi:serine protease
VITVAATTSAGARASFSNYGPLVEIAAPGGAIWSTVNSGKTIPVAPAGAGTYAQYSGTSMAAPHVAAVAALMLAARPSLTPAQVVAYMQQTAHPFAPSGCPPGCGSGIVDAARAVAAAVTGGPVPTPTPTAMPTPTPTPGPTGTPRPSPTPSPTPGPGCVHGTPTVAASPTLAIVPRGSSATVTLSVRNTDAAGCGTSTFTWSAALLAGSSAFSSSFVGSASVIVAPGATVSTAARIAVSARSVAGSVASFQYTATRGVSPASGSVVVAATAR